jgi:hypothetical protein
LCNIHNQLPPTFKKCCRVICSCWLSSLVFMCYGEFIEQDAFKGGGTQNFNLINMICIIKWAGWNIQWQMNWTRWQTNQNFEIGFWEWLTCLWSKFNRNSNQDREFSVLFPLQEFTFGNWVKILNINFWPLGFWTFSLFITFCQY